MVPSMKPPCCGHSRALPGGVDWVQIGAGNIIKKVDTYVELVPLKRLDTWTEAGQQGTIWW